ncbi:MAG: NHL repeat-containing protein [Dehalococcoidia bacterium]|nr:NHL repeat-containing protein [Dehalococcoidia bacterium]
MTTTTFGLKYVTNVGFAADFGGRGFQLPSSMAIRADGVIFVVSRGKSSTKNSNGIQMVTKDHDFLGQIGTYGAGLGGMMWPTSVVLDGDENLYLADEYFNKVTKYDREGNPITEWGTKGSGDGQFNQPSGLLIQDQLIYLVDSRNNRIQMYSLEGEFQGQWGSGGDGEGEFNLPWGISDDSEGNIYIADWRNDRIQKFDSNGNYISAIGGGKTSVLDRPSDVAVDPDGNIYVTDWGSQRLLVLDQSGSILETKRGEADLNPWSVEYLSSQDDERKARESFVPVYQADTEDPSEVSARMEPYFWDPVAVELDQDGTVYVLETGRHRFQVFERF